MINISLIMDHVKGRLGVSHRQIEFSDEALVKCLIDNTLKTLSIYHPFYCMLFMDSKNSEVMPNMNTYYVPTELGDDFELMSVEYIGPMNSPVINQSQSSNNTNTSFNSVGHAVYPSPYTFLPSGGNFQSIITSLTTMKIAGTLSNAGLNSFTFDFIPPNMVRLNSPLGTSNLFLIVRTTHKKDFTTLPFGLLDAVKELAFYDVAIDIYSIRKYFSNVKTLFAEINLDMETYQDALSKRETLIERFRKNQLKYSSSKKIYFG